MHKSKILKGNSKMRATKRPSFSRVVDCTLLCVYKIAAKLVSIKPHTLVTHKEDVIKGKTRPS